MFGEDFVMAAPGTANFAMPATVNCSCPLMSLLTSPRQRLGAADRVVMCSALILAAAPGSHSRCFGLK